MRCRLGAIVACVIAVLSLSSARAAENGHDRLAAHLLDRLAFGPTLADLRHARAAISCLVTLRQRT
jgi:hypothetical protein